MMKAAGIFYTTGNEFLLVKRRADAVQGGTWAFPAGSIEPGENAMQAAEREFKEETGRVAPNGLVLLNRNEDFVLFKGVGEKFEPLLNNEHTAFVWASAASLPEPLHPGVREIVTMHGMDSAQKTDRNGFVSIDRNPISRSGIFPYLGRSIGADQPDRVYYVYRPAEELASQECIDSFKLIPIVDDHTMIGDGFTPAEEKGVHGSTGEDVSFENNVLYSNLKIFSEAVKKLIKTGKKHLSLGYRCMYDKASGTYNGMPYDYIQRNLRGNHLALVDQSRCDVLVLDSHIAMDYADVDISLIDSTDPKELKMADENKKTGEDNKDVAALLTALDSKLTTVIGRLDKVEKAAADAAEEEKKDEEAEKKAAADKKAADDALAAAAEKKEEKKEGAMDAAEIKKMREEFDSAIKNAPKAALQEAAKSRELAAKLSPFIGAFDHADKTLGEVVQYGVEKLGIKCEKGQEQAALDGYLHNRPAPNTQKVVTFDAAVQSKSSVAGYLKGKK